MQVYGILQTVENIEKVSDFYISALGCKKIKESSIEGTEFDHLFQLPHVKAKIIWLELGKERLLLLEFISPKGKPYPTDSKSHDMWFLHFAIVVSDMDKAHPYLKGKVEAISLGPQTIPDENIAAAGIKAFYFRSPNAHPHEIIYFPKGKGDPSWQEETKNLFIGIDHIAIAASDTDRSLAFYRDLLGMQIVGKSLNFGKTQEDLTHVKGAKVQITTLHFANEKEIGIELLHYLHPRTGRRKEHVKANDLSESQIIIQAEDLSSIQKKIGKYGSEIISMPKGFAFKKMMRARDPDDHGILFVESSSRSFTT